MSETASTFSTLMKEIYDDQRIDNLIYSDNPLLAELAKDEEFGGKTYPQPIIAFEANGVGADFATAQTFSNSSSGAAKEFLVNTRGKIYGVASWDQESMWASEKDLGAFMKVAEVQVDTILRSLGNTISTCLYRDGYGGWAQIDPSTSLSSTTLQLKKPADVVNFSVNRGVDFAATSNASSVKAGGSSGNNLTITAIDRDKGTLTFAYALNDGTNGVPTVAANDYIFLRGVRSTSVALLPVGLESWLPATAPTSGDSFFGVDRSGDPQRLAGCRLNGLVGGSLEQTLMKAATIVAKAGGKLNRFYMSHEYMYQLEAELQNRKVVIENEVTDQVGFSGIRLLTGKGPVEVYADRSCPADRIFGLTLDTWKLATPGKTIRCMNSDGFDFLRKSTTDGYEARYAMMGQLICSAPGWNINIQVPAIT